jgi:N-acylneuraminate cytidylyltransferase
LPGKNLRELAGLPLIAHSIKLGQLCPEIDTLIVSTDSEDIAAVAVRHGATVPFLRPAELAGDDVPTIPVLQHALREMELLGGKSYGSVLLLDPTSPGRLPAHVASACEMLQSAATADGVIACSQPSFNPFFVGVINESGYLRRACGNGAYTQRQTVPKFFRVNGSLYLWRSAFLRNCPAAWLDAGSFLMLEIPEEFAFSIDTLSEFQIADFVISSGLIPLPWLEQSEGARS